MAKYLYNDIPLPVLPNEVLVQPNIFIGNTDDSAVAIGFSGAPQTWKPAGIQFVGSKEEGNKIRAKITSDGTGWEIVETVDNTTFSYPLAEVNWANFDVLNADGTLYLAASEPIPILAPTLDPLSLFLGWKAGNWVARQRGKKKTPVAYLYNGVRLPKLPEWDKVNNPCAAIMRIEVDGTAHALLAVAQYADSRFAIRNNKNGDPVVMAKVSGYYVGINSFNCIAMFYAPLSGGEWVATTESFSCNAEDLIWSNFDVADARTDDGTVFLAASDPIPVYE